MDEREGPVKPGVPEPDHPRDPRLHPGDRPGEDVREEIGFYLEQRAREFEALGMDPESARRAALQAFGDPDAVAEEVRRIDEKHERDGRWTMRWSALAQDLRYSVRGLVKRPASTAVLVLTLGLGIGAVTAIFSVVDASLLQALPFESADELVFLQGAYDAPEGPQIRFASPPEAEDWAELNRSFSGVAVADGTNYDLTTDGSTERIPAERVGSGYFDILQMDAVRGRTFSEEEYRAGWERPAVVLGHGLWTRRFGADPGVIGRQVQLSGTSFTVVGVAPADFAGTTLQAEAFVPISVIGPENLQARGSRYLNVLARLAPGVSVEAARRDMADVSARLQELHPDINEDRIAVVTPLREAYLGDTRLLVLVVLAAAALLLVIAAANVVSLLLVRATARSGEVLLRQALGAGRRRLLAQFVTEGVVLSAAGATVGLAFGIWGAGALAAAMPATLLPAFVDVRPSLGVFLVAAAVMTAVGVVAGLAPGILAARRDVATGLRNAAGGLVGSGSRVHRALVVGEVAVALLLLVGAGLMARSFRTQLAIEPGYDPGLYAFRVVFAEDRYTDDALPSAVQDLMARLEARPEIAQATFASDLPLRGGFTATYLWLDGATEREDRIRFYFHRVAPDWFGTVGTSILQGRALDARDDAGAAESAVISRAMARRFFGEQEPLGRTLTVGGPDGLLFTVVGVAEDVRYRDLTTDIEAGADDPDVYLPWLRVPNRSVGVAVRPRSGDAAALGGVVRDVVDGFDGNMSVFADGPMADDLRAQTAQARFGSVLLTAFSGLAAVLALVGLYGVLAFDVGRRSREIAVRVAVGAASGDVRRMVVAAGMKLALTGLALGLGAALLASRSLEAFLFGVEPADAATYAVTAAGLALFALGAIWIPALRATRVDPQTALKAE